MKFLIFVALVAAATAAPADPTTVAPTPDPDLVHLPGGLHKIEVSDGRLIEVLSQAQDDLNARMNSLHFYKVGTILEAATQVVAGVMYHVKFEFGATSCLKAGLTMEMRQSGQCTGFDQVQVCTVRVLSVPWTHTFETSSFHCEAKVVAAPSTGAELPGGHHKLDTHDADLAKLLTEVTPQVNDKFASTQYQRIGTVLSAESQVVSGVLYHVSFELGETKCTKAQVTKDTKIETECTGFSHVHTCTAKIWSQPWLHHTELTELHCEARKLDVPSPGDIRGPTIPL